MFYCVFYHITLILFCYTLVQYQENVTVMSVHSEIQYHTEHVMRIFCHIVKVDLRGLC